MKPKETEIPPLQECQNCYKMATEGVEDGDIGFVCQECVDNAVNETGFCSLSCQLGRGCDGSC